MSQSTQTIANLLNGVSQQAIALRLPTQASIQENGLSSLTRGLTKRPASKYIRDLPATNESFLHLVDRPSERYVIHGPGDGTLAIFPTDGDIDLPAVVLQGSAADYLTVDDPRTNLRAVTIADTTFIVNRTRTVMLDPDQITDSLPATAIIRVLEGGSPEVTYTVLIDGVAVAEFETGDTALSQSTRTIAQGLFDDLVGTTPPQTIEVRRSGRFGGGGGATIENTTIEDLERDDLEFELQGSTILVTSTTNQDFTIAVRDGRSDTRIQAFQHDIQQFPDLPRQAPDGYLVRVGGTATDGADDFWVEFAADDPNTFGDGAWEETTGPETLTNFDPATLPHLVEPDGVGGFIVRPAEWQPRTAGDEELIPAPSLVGQTISDIFYFRTRLGLVSDLDLVFSRPNDVTDLWRQTATDLLDNDPIDVELSSSLGSPLQAAVPIDRRLVVFSAREQFLVESDQAVFGPNGISSSISTAYDSDLGPLRPLFVGRSVMFPHDQGRFTGYWEYVVSDEADTFAAEELTAHIPRYIPTDLIYHASNTDDPTVVVGDGSEIMTVYRFYNRGRERVQSSWSQFRFPAPVAWAEFISTDLYFVMDGVLCELDVSDDDDEPVHLDSFFEPEVTFDASTGFSTLTAPYDLVEAGEFQAVVTGQSGPFRDGQILRTQDTLGDTTRVRGDLRGVPVLMGRPYTMIYQFSPQFFRNDGGTIYNGRYQWLRLGLLYDRTAYFTTHVQPGPGYPEYVQEFSGKAVGTVSAVIDRRPIDSGEFIIPVNGRGDTATVEIRNDSPLPSSFSSAFVVGFFQQRSRI